MKNMTATSAPVSKPLERWLASLLRYGTWVASLTIATGFVLTLLDTHAGAHRAAWPDGMRIVTAGIALFILLPVLRLMLMLGVFLHQRDYRFSAITLLVLLIVAAGCAVGAQ
jgi:uncharacterized membrane protein